jgi:4-amino-4-deoxy-L-arabinose transferase-like glycosyltransferase
MRETVWHILLILLVTGVVFFSNLGSARLWDRDEPRNAGCAAEMLERGDWVVPIFNDELRHQKPVLLYWLIMSAYSVFGVNEFSARFWSASLAVGTTFATYLIARRLINSTVALYAALALATSLMFDVAARAATPDSVLTFFATSALATYVLGTFVKSKSGLALRNSNCWFPQHFGVVGLIYSLLGLAVLAKGPVGFLLPMAMIGMFMLIQRLPIDSQTDRTWYARFTSSAKVFHPIHFLKTLWSMRPITAALIILVIAAPWYFLVDARTQGDFTRLFFVGEHFGRATTALENHSGGLWFYPLAILIGFFPWSVFWGPVVVSLISRKRNSHQQSQQNQLQTNQLQTRLTTAPACLMLCWIGIQVGAFSMVQTKLPSYVVPCYPALAILTCTCIVGWTKGTFQISRNWFVAAILGLVISGFTITLGVGFATHRFLPSQFWLTGLGLIPLLAGLAILVMAIRQRMTYALPLFATMATLFCLMLFGAGTVSLDGEQESDKIIAAIDPGNKIATFGCLESSWVFYAGQPIYELEKASESFEKNPQNWPSNSQNANPQNPQQPRPFWKPKPRMTPEAFLVANPEAVFITTDDQLEDIKKRLPKDYQVIQTADYFLKNKQLVLLGRKDRIAENSSDNSKTTR